VQALLQNDSDTSLRDWRDLTPLELAIACIDISYTKLLLKFGANPNLQNSEGQTALHRAFKMTNIPEKRALSIQLINLLGEYDAELSIKDNQGRTPRSYSKGTILAKGPMYMINSRQINQLRRQSFESDSESDSENNVASYCLTM
jgi:ankyrin repeat protein